MNDVIADQHNSITLSTRDELYEEVLQVAEKTGVAPKWDSQSLFPASVEGERIRLFCDDPRTLSRLWKLSWLIGNQVDVVCPHVLVHKNAHDYSDALPSEDHDYHYYYGQEFFEWKEKVEEELVHRAPRLLPAFSLFLHHEFDFDDPGFSVHTISVTGSNLDGPLVLSDAYQQLQQSVSLNLDVPAVLISDDTLVQRVCTDYPHSAAAFKTIIRDSYSVFREEAQAYSRPAIILERLHDEVVQPGVARIRSEHRELWKNWALRTLADSVLLTVPLQFSILDLAEFHSVLIRLLSAGLGLRLTDRVLDLRSSLVRLRREPFFAALKLRFNE